MWITNMEEGKPQNLKAAERQFTAPILKLATV